MRRAWCLALCYCLAGCQRSPAPPAALVPEVSATRIAFDPTDFDPAVRPQDDFYQFVNGRWISQTEIPADLSTYGVLQALRDQTEEQLRALLESDGMAREPAYRKLRDLYASFMDEERVEQAGLGRLAPALARIDALRSHADVVEFMGHLMAERVDGPVTYEVIPGADDPTKNLLYLEQSGLGLPDRDYYLLEGERFARIREAYVKHIERMFETAAWPDPAASAQTIMRLETSLAEKQWSRVQNRDSERIDRSRYSFDTARTLAPELDWERMLAAGDFGHPVGFIIAQTDYFKALGPLIRSSPVANWQVYFRFRVLDSYAPYLSKAIVAEDFEFNGKVLRGRLENRPRWKRAAGLVSDSLGELMGQAYVNAHFPPIARKNITLLIERLREAYAAAIRELSWMSPNTRSAALEKLRQITLKVGYPEKWRDYGPLEINAEDLIGNVSRARAFAHKHELEKLEKPVDRTEWNIPPQTVNAFYDRKGNEIVFPAAVLQRPLFDPNGDEAANFGSIGAAIGHEMSHGFDDQGRKYDGAGRLRDWWSESDAVRYKAQSLNLVRQYNAFRPIPDLAVNGELTLGENIADLAGLIIAHRAYLLSLGNRQAPLIAGYSGEQRFFIAWAMTWRGKFRNELIRERLLADPHAPFQYRVIGTLQNMPEFYAAFDVKPGDKMYLPPAERARIW
jgi:predicted metalloendopeptidase